MSPTKNEKSDAAEARTTETQAFVRQVRAQTRRRYSAEEKIRIVLEGFRREVTVNELCRREGSSCSGKTANSNTWWRSYRWTSTA